MIISTQVPLHRLILSLSKAVDCVHPAVADHQHRVTYISLEMARRLGMPKLKLMDLFYAAALHDIGLVRHDQKISALPLNDLEAVPWHSEIGYQLLRDNPLFAQAAEAVRYHHVPWAHGCGVEVKGNRVPYASHILVVADAVARALDCSANPLEQSEAINQQIIRQSDKFLHPECVDAFREASKHPAFWLNCASNRIYSIILEQMDWPSLTVNEETINPIASIFARVVDAASQWTATHTAGVAGTAVALAERLKFSPRELMLMRAAGLFHDLGKLTVPCHILHKPGKLSPADWNLMKAHTFHTFRILNTIGGMPQICEWAAFHHERIDGKGYPFGHDGQQLTLGARIMAVADVFTAICEDRPYRQGMKREEAFAVLDKLVEDGGLDGDVTAVMKRDFDEIDMVRRAEQSGYGQKQGHI